MLVSLIAVVVIGSIAFLGVQVFGLFSDTEDAVAQATEPITVSAPLAGTLPNTPPTNSVDSCPSLPGAQPAPFDCSLPLNVPAVPVGNSGNRIKYTCPNDGLYQLVRGQKLELNKQCVLASAQ